MQKNTLAGLMTAYKKEFGDTKKLEEIAESMENGDFSGTTELAELLVKLKSDENTVLSALIYENLKNNFSFEKCEKKFGKKIAENIDSVTRFEKALEFQPENKENFKKKLFILLSASPNIVMIELAKALATIRKIDSLEREKAQEIIKNVKEIYSPLAHKIGVYGLSAEMNDLAFRHEDKENYEDIKKAIEETAKQTQEDIGQTKKSLESELEKTGIDAVVSGREKSIYSTYRKMNRKKVGIKKIYDLIALRVITENIRDCYEVLGIIHSKWKPIPGEFDDYIAKPKENGYQALHTAIVSTNNNPIEIQVRTKEMNLLAEYGIAAHWRYKGEKTDSKEDQKIDWIKQVLEWQKETGEKTEITVFGKQIFVLTPKGEVIELPEGATIIDFAYALHSDLGNKCSNAKVNGKIAALNTELRNGDLVEIMTSKNQVPKMSWLGFVKTAKAKQKIRAKLNVQHGHTHKILANKKQAIKMNDKRVRLAKCCSPLPGNEIIGIKTTKRKISVHRTDCHQLDNFKGDKINVEWHSATGHYDTGLIVKGRDNLGLLKTILDVFSKTKIHVNSTNARSGSGNKIECRFNLKIKNASEFAAIAKKISALKGVTEVYKE